MVCESLNRQGQHVTYFELNFDTQAPSAYQQPATYNQASAYPAQTAYQAPAASGYNAYQAQSTPTQQSSYAPNTGYTQQYASAQQPGASAYSAPLTSTGYSTGTTGEFLKCMQSPMR